MRIVPVTRWSLLLLVVCALSVPAYANMGTALMLLGFFWVVFLNLFIGVGEALLIHRLVRRWNRHPFLTMVVANYVSAVVGLFALGIANILMPARPIFYLPWLMGVTYLVFFC